MYPTSVQPKRKVVFALLYIISFNWMNVHEFMYAWQVVTNLKEKMDNNFTLLKLFLFIGNVPVNLEKQSTLQLFQQSLTHHME